MQTPPSASDKGHAPVSPLEVLRNFHKELPLEGDPQNALLSLPDDQLSYLLAAIRNTPRSPPDLSLDDWHTFLALLRPHGIFPLIAYHVRTWPEECRPPQEIQEYLDRLFLLAAARSLRAGRQIRTVTDALEGAGIPVILLKGHALARTVYPDAALRQSSDIDLLVQPHNIPATEEVLEKLGYVCPARTFQLSLHEYPYEHFFPDGKGLEIDLHWVPDNAFGLFTEGWLDEAFSRRIPLRSGDLSCDTFSHPDHLLFLAFHHIFKHGSIRLDMVYDAALVMKEINAPDAWRKIVQQSVQNHIRIPLELLLSAACLWTRYGLPAGCENFSAWPVPRERELQLRNYSKTRCTSLYSWVYLALQARPGIREKLRCGYRLILPPPEMLEPYRKSSSKADIPLAHLRRWSRFAKLLVKR